MIRSPVAGWRVEEVLRKSGLRYVELNSTFAWGDNLSPVADLLLTVAFMSHCSGRLVIGVRCVLEMVGVLEW